MDNNVLVNSEQNENGLVNNYTLYDNGDVKHVYNTEEDKNAMNTEHRQATHLSEKVKNRLYHEAEGHNKERVKKILNLGESKRATEEQEREEGL